MILRGELAEMMVHIAPQIYRPYVNMDKKVTPILYVRLKKALYGLLISSLLFYRKLHGELRHTVLISILMTHEWVTKW